MSGRKKGLKEGGGDGEGVDRRKDRGLDIYDCSVDA